MDDLTPLPGRTLYEEDYSAWREQLMDVREELIGRYADIFDEYEDPAECVEALQSIVEFYNPGEEVERLGTLDETRVYRDDDRIVFEEFVAHDAEDDILDYVSVVYHPDAQTWWFGDKELPEEVRGRRAHEEVAYRAVEMFPWGDERDI